MEDAEHAGKEFLYGFMLGTPGPGLKLKDVSSSRSSLELNSNLKSSRLDVSRCAGKCPGSRFDARLGRPTTQ